MRGDLYYSDRKVGGPTPTWSENRDSISGPHQHASYSVPGETSAWQAARRKQIWPDTNDRVEVDPIVDFRGPRTSGDGKEPVLPHEPIDLS